MAKLIVRNLPDDVYHALRAQAEQHGCSIEAEVRKILGVAVKPEARVRLGDALAEPGRKVGISDDDLEVFEQLRDKTPVEPMDIERTPVRPKGQSMRRSEDAVGLQELIRQVERIVTQSGSGQDFNAAQWVARWLEQPLPALGNAKPVDFINTAEGRELLASLLARIQSSALS